jgi:16S rRNA (uracil1498-N3)-methyltransferase
MGRHRLFVTPATVDEHSVHFDRDQSHQLARVLRVGRQEPVVVLTGDGQEFLVELRQVDPKACIGEIVDRRLAAAKPRLAVSLYQALLPRERFELALTKATEVGIERFTPVRTRRVVARFEESGWPARESRLVALAREASEQSERGALPSIGKPMAFAEAVRQACSAGPTLIAWERGAAELTRSELRTMAAAAGQISIFVGPEGGFTPEEIAAGRELGAGAVWLGPRILRAETTGLVLAAILLYESGDLGLSS